MAAGWVVAAVAMGERAVTEGRRQAAVAGRVAAAAGRPVAVCVRGVDDSSRAFIFFARCAADLFMRAAAARCAAVGGAVEPQVCHDGVDVPRRGVLGGPTRRRVV